jgi:hypothetical protein
VRASAPETYNSYNLLVADRQRGGFVAPNALDQARGDLSLPPACIYSPISS